MDVEESSLEDVAREADVEIPEVAEANSNELAVGAAVSKEATVEDMMLEEDAAVQEVDAVLDGRTTTSHNETGMLQSISNLTGRCLRRSTSSAWLN